MSYYKIHILYEYGIDWRPHSSSFIRLLRPFAHPLLQPYLEVTYDRTYEGQAVDVVILDRFWHPYISFPQAVALVEQVRRAGAKLIYALDDNLLDIPIEEHRWYTREHRWTAEFLLKEVTGVLVSTEPLRTRLIEYNPNIVVVPNALDERLLTGKRLYPIKPLFGPKRLTIGYMGTPTHNSDLKMILPALKTIWQRYSEKIEFQIVGALRDQHNLKWLEELSFRFVRPNPNEVEYPLFMLWFLNRVHWDIAIAPLQDIPFTRCKSDIKFLDYSALGTAGVFSRVPAYQSTVRHLETGWLVDNEVEAWVEALETLIAKANLRQQLAQNSSEYLYSQRVLAHRAQDWLEALEILLAQESTG